MPEKSVAAELRAMSDVELREENNALYFHLHNHMPRAGAAERYALVAAEIERRRQRAQNKRWALLECLQGPNAYVKVWQIDGPYFVVDGPNTEAAFRHQGDALRRAQEIAGIKEEKSR